MLETHDYPSGAGESMLHCRDCEHWYGEEDGGYGPCNLKLGRGEKRHITFGGHVCDEGF